MHFPAKFSKCQIWFLAHTFWDFADAKILFQKLAVAKKVPISSAHHSRNMNLEFASIFLTSREVSLFEFFPFFERGAQNFSENNLILATTLYNTLKAGKCKQFGVNACLKLIVLDFVS